MVGRGLRPRGRVRFARAGWLAVARRRRASRGALLPAQHLQRIDARRAPGGPARGKQPRRDQDRDGRRVRQRVARCDAEKQRLDERARRPSRLAPRATTPRPMMARPRLNTRRAMCPGVAPSVRRIAISRVRPAAQCATAPNRPMEARNTPSSPSATESSPTSRSSLQRLLHVRLRAVRLDRHRLRPRARRDAGAQLGLGRARVDARSEARQDGGRRGAGHRPVDDLLHARAQRAVDDVGDDADDLERRHLAPWKTACQSPRARVPK